MKRIIQFIFFLSLSVGYHFPVFVPAQDFADPVGYLEYINQEYNTISEAQLKYIKASSHRKAARKVEQLRREVVAATRESEKKVRRMPHFGGSTQLRDSVATHLHVSYLLFTENYARLVDMEEVAEQSYDLMEAYILAKELAREKSTEVWDRTDLEFKRFAAANNINLIEEKSSTVKQLEAASKVFRYHNRWYLAYFKTNKQEAYMIAALSKGDITDIEQNRNALLTAVEESRQMLDTLPDFEDDASLKESLIPYLDFCEREASVHMPQMSVFFLKREELEMVQATVQNIKNPPQDVIDRYNKLVEDFNESVKDFNKTNETLNKERYKLVAQADEAAADFFDRHVP